MTEGRRRRERTERRAKKRAQAKRARKAGVQPAKRMQCTVCGTSIPYATTPTSDDPDMVNVPVCSRCKPALDLLAARALIEGME